MADITKCSNGNTCVNKEDCYRWKAKSCDYSQAWSEFYKEGEDCEMFWSIGKWSNDYGK